MNSLKLLILPVFLTVFACEQKVQESDNFAQDADPAYKLDTALIEKTLKDFTDNGALPGVSALVYVDGEEQFFGAYGKADMENNEPMRRDTLVQIFSMTKPITGVALMTLYEQGKFKLDDLLEQHAPEFADLNVYTGLDDEGKAIYEAPHRLPTIYDVMRHTAGFVSGHGGDNPVLKINSQVDAGNRNNTHAEFLSKLATIPLLHQPGTQWLYGPSVDVQAALVEKFSGMPFDQYVIKHIFEPLKMQNTQWRLRENQHDQLAAIYTWKEDKVFERIPDEEAYSYYVKDWPMKYGSWGLTSTLDDYMRFARMLVNGGELEGKRILQPATVKLMATDAIPETVTDRSWLSGKGQVGFGIDFAVRVAEPENAEEASGEIGEFFWDGAANTMFWVDPKNQLTAVLFTQYRPFGKVPLHKAFRDAVYTHDQTASALQKSAKFSSTKGQ